VTALWLFVAVAVLAALRWSLHRLQLSRAKHPSLAGHARLSQLIARFVPFYEYGEDEFFATDDAPADVRDRRQVGFNELARRLREKAPKTLALTEELEEGISDLQFIDRYRVPFQVRGLVRDRLRVGAVAVATKDRRIADLDGNWSLDAGGAYGMNVFGYEVYKRCIAKAEERARELGPVLGLYHPIVADNVRRLKEISGLDEVSFHMSGTEAVMQAVRLARYHTRRSHVVRFAGAYHGWWDGVQAGAGNPRPPHEVYTLRDMSEKSLRVLATRKDIACVLVNPLQAMHPNAGASSDGALVGSRCTVPAGKAAYGQWLRELRDICTRRGIVLILDEVFLGFRLAPGGAQEYFSVKADLVTYGKTLGGGLPVGVVCGRAELMRRFRDDRPTDINFARGTFNAHPYVMTAMNEILLYLDSPELRASYVGLDALWDARAHQLNEALAASSLPIRVQNLTSVFTTLFTQPSRYAWMLQYYLRAHGIAMSWVGTGRFIFSHDYTNADFADFASRFVAASEVMATDGFFWADVKLTDRWIRRRVLFEMIEARLLGRRRPSRGQKAPAELAPALQAESPTCVL
jgi:glutamate-1-semialdehyde 2,1-aminomutase